MKQVTAREEEAMRLAEIDRLKVPQAQDDAQLQHLVDRAAHELGMPTALVSIVLDSSQYFTASHGLTGWLAETRGTPREWSFCTHAVEKKADFVVNDAENDAQMKENPLVLMEGVRCYAGIPLITSRGYAVGTLCVIGGESHSFDEQELSKLRDLASQVMGRLEDLVLSLNP